jgi:hypothetical protein
MLLLRYLQVSTQEWRLFSYLGVHNLPASMCCLAVMRMETNQHAVDFWKPVSLHNTQLIELRFVE